VTGDWDSIPARCTSHPKEATFVHKYTPNDTTLHRLLRTSSYCFGPENESSGDLEVTDLQKRSAVIALLDAYPEAVGIRDSFGKTPLHLACQQNNATSSPIGCDIAFRLVQEFPDAIIMPDVEGRTPLHLLLMSRNTRQASLGNSTTPDGESDTKPVEIPIKLVQSMLDRRPKVVTILDAVRQTPLDVVNRREEKNEISNATAVRKLLSRY